MGSILNYFLGKLRATFRFLFFLLLTMATIIKLLLFALIGKLNLERGLGIRKQWANSVLRLLNVQIQTRRKKDYENVVYISNHRSYLDPIIKLSQVNTLVLAKKEVSYWPLIGYGMKLTGSYFVKREQKDSRKEARDNIAKTVKEGHSILLYPEGTTTILPSTLPFKPRTFHMAAENQIKIVPVAIEYQDQAVAFIGDDTFLPHFFKVFAKPKIVGIIDYGTPIWSEDGEKLRQACQDWVHAKLQEIRPELGLKN